MKYADDITLVMPLKPLKREIYKSILQKKIEEEIDNIEAQSSLLNLCINRSKSKAMIISRSSQLKELSLTIPITNSLKILGIMINEKLDWGAHTRYVCKKAPSSS